MSLFLRDNYPYNLDLCLKNMTKGNCYNSNTTEELNDILGQLHLNFQIDWLRKYRGVHVTTFSSYGWCSTFNIVNDRELFHGNSTAQYFMFKPSLMTEITGKLVHRIINPQKPPLFTNQSDYGVHAFIFDQENATVIIHSPFETPDLRHRNFLLTESETARISIEPVIKITDETLLDLNVDE